MQMPNLLKQENREPVDKIIDEFLKISTYQEYDQR